MDKVKQIFIFLLLSFCIMTTQAEKTMVYLEHCETLSFDEEIAPDCQILTGNVRFRHDSAYMYCDSAYFYNKKNTIDAYSNIRIIQGDSIRIYGDKLNYNGDTKIAKLRGNVRMEHGNMTLYTDSLNYDRNLNVGYYFNGGRIVDTENVLTSVRGKYYPNTDLAVFQHDVVLTNKQFVLYSDTLHYNTKSNIAYILGPSNIISDSSTIYTEYGWYNTKIENAELLKNSSLVDKDNHILTGDTIFYNKAQGYAEGKSNVCMRDTANKIMIKGMYGMYYEKSSNGYMIDHATFIEHSSQDTLYLTADTLFFNNGDSTTIIHGNYNVQAWQIEVQLICDSMYYSTSDSILRIFGTPVCWNDKNQITGDSIYAFTKNSSIEHLEIMGSGFVFMQVDSTDYNQVSGKKIYAYLNDGRVHKIFVDGNATSVYFIEDEPDPDGTPVDYTGINKAESSELTIYVDKDNRPKRIIMTPSSNGVMYTPDKKDNDAITLLTGFMNCSSLRPTDKDNIYVPKDKNKLKEVDAKKPRHKRRER